MIKVPLGQHIMIGVSGPSLTEAEKKFIIENDIGGVTLFAPRNVQSAEQVHELCSEIQALSRHQPSQLPLIVAVDMEGGRVARFRVPPFTLWPPVANLGRHDSIELSENFAEAMGEELRAVGINVNWAPCADVWTNPLNTIIGDRAVSTDPVICARHVQAMIRGFRKANILSCAKHFPGHGQTLVDSHEELPRETQSLTQLHLGPFRAAIAEDAELIMTSHILFESIDPNYPVTLSKIFLQTVLRQDLNFKKVIVSDDLGMKAMTKYFAIEQIPVLALQAGVDILLYCNEPDSPPAALESMKRSVSQNEVSESALSQSLSRIIALKKTLATSRRPWDHAKAVIGSESHQAIAKRMR